MAQFKRTIGGAVAVLLSMSGMSPALAESWGPMQPAFGKGTAVCNGRDDEGNTFCFGLRCTVTDNSPEWFTIQIGGGSDRGSVATRIIIDGKHHFQIPMTERQWQNQWDFAGAYDTTEHAALVNALKAGSRVSVQVGRETQANLSLRGSSREIAHVLSICEADGQTQPSDQTSAQLVNEPYDAVLAMATKQDCIASEEEIFAAITGAGFDAWTANQFVAIGAEDGSLQLIDNTAETYRYRLPLCEPH